MTNREALNINFQRATRAELSKAVTQLRKTAKAREKTISRSGYYSHALTQLQTSGSLTAKNRGSDINTLRRHYRALQRFMEAQGSTVSGLKRMNTSISNRIGSSYNDLTISEKSDFWSTVDKVLELVPNAKSVLGSDPNNSEVQRLTLLGYNKGYDENQIADLIKERMNTELSSVNTQFNSILEEEFWNG